MESTVLQHVLRLSAGLPIYVEPTPEFLALAYNPLFYAVCVPFVRAFGPTLAAIRTPAMLASVGAAFMVALLVKRLTRSFWWGFMAMGVFAASNRVTDCYLDIGHRDSFLLLSILVGFWLLDRGGGRLLGPLPGILALAGPNSVSSRLTHGECPPTSIAIRHLAKPRNFLVTAPRVVATLSSNTTSPFSFNTQ